MGTAIEGTRVLGRRKLQNIGGAQDDKSYGGLKAEVDDRHHRRMEFRTGV